jgi:hypothetical protein
MKDYNTWLAEGESHFSEPTSLETTIGNGNTPLDPRSENWEAQINQLGKYLDFSKEVQQSLDSDDNQSIKELVSRAKELPLFSTEPETTWRRVGIDGADISPKDNEFRKSIARYIISKIDQFNSWCKDRK